jgi:pilus assembly protein CpaB
MVRRGLAALLVLIALVLAVRPGSGAETAAVLVAVHDLDPGVTLRPADVAVRRWPVADVPGGALHEPAEVDGQVLAGAARAGEPLTDLRLVGPGLASRASAEPEVARVPVRLADADVAGLLYPGAAVDVVAAAEPAGAPTVLASAAVVLAVLPAQADAARRGRLVLVALPRAVATRVAGASLAQPVTVTLR